MAAVFAVILVIVLLQTAEGEIRCYCNAAPCINTGYMCKSHIGRCYSQVPLEGDITKTATGCIDLLPDKGLCDVIDASMTREGRPVLKCCEDDMCNYVNNRHIDTYVNTKSNGSHLKGQHTVASDTRLRHLEEYGQHYISPSNQLWFKAAVIAVPIAGGFILILLVLLAIRMLRHDSSKHHRLMQLRKHDSVTKAQLYVADHFNNPHFNTIDNQVMQKDINILIEKSGSGSRPNADRPVQHSLPFSTASPNSSVLVLGSPNVRTDTSTIV